MESVLELHDKRVIELRKDFSFNYSKDSSIRHLKIYSELVTFDALVLVGQKQQFLRNNFHGVNSLLFYMSHQVHRTERPFANHFLNLKVILAHRIYNQCIRENIGCIQVTPDNC